MICLMQIIKSKFFCIDINDCLVGGINPCKNGGTCTDGIATYTCTCAAGFEGPDCSIGMKFFFKAILLI